MSEPRFPLVLIDVQAEDADAASSLLFDLGATGLEERDETTLARGAPGRVTLVASFESDEDAEGAAASLPREWRPRLDVIVGDGFRDEWKKFFRPFVLTPGIVVRPPWETYVAERDERLLVLEPGRAFGTGLHETTSLVADGLVRHAAEALGKSVLDVGCGSGILSLLSLMLGASSARCVDVDPEAVGVTRDNASLNGMADRLVADTTPVSHVRGEYPVVVANIEARVLIDLAPAIMAKVAPGGFAVLSGILAPDVMPQVEDVVGAFTALRLEDSTRKGEWVALLLRAPA